MKDISGKLQLFGAVCAILFLNSNSLVAQSTELIYLSGTGFDQTSEWDLSFMLGIPAIGTKFKKAEQLGPQSKDYFYNSKRVDGGALQIDLTFEFK